MGVATPEAPEAVAVVAFFLQLEGVTPGCVS